MKLIDLKGKKFNRLTVLEYAGKSKWLCKCDCGNLTTVIAPKLKSGHTKSCGCFQKEQASKFNRKYEDIKKARILRKKWYHMLDRCYDKNSKRYKDWGGRGIKVCEEWHNFENFYNWAIISGYKGLPQKYESLDRINNNGNYEPNNCRWADAITQNNNKRNSRRKNG